MMTTHEGDSRSQRCDEPQVGTIEWWMITMLSKKTILSADWKYQWLIRQQNGLRAQA